MRQLQVQLPPMRHHKRGGPWREAVFFCIAFVTVFGAVMIGLDVLS